MTFDMAKLEPFIGMWRGAGEIAPNPWGGAEAGPALAMLKIHIVGGGADFNFYIAKRLADPKACIGVDGL